MEAEIGSILFRNRKVRALQSDVKSARIIDRNVGMNIARQITSLINHETLNYDFFLDNLTYCLAKGRGFSVFNADEHVLERFLEHCGSKGCDPPVLRLSEIGNHPPEIPVSQNVVVIVQDVTQSSFLAQASLLADRIIFPLWFRGTSICLFSFLDRGAYEENQISAGHLHEDFQLVVNSLLYEQIFTLLDRVNYQFSSPEFINVSKHKLVLTPIEEKMLEALEASKLSYEPQVRFGKFTVDFLVDIGNGKVIVECDGKTYHNAEKDRERDKVLAREGYPIFHFSSTEIYRNIDQCIETLRNSQTHNVKPAYALDDELDASQTAAIHTGNGPARVLAPAGSGKTKTLINRILFLLNQGIPAEKILALAFNKKARDEMQERLDRKGVKGVEVRTFHSFGYEIVREKFAGWTFNARSYQRTVKQFMNSAIQQHTELPAKRNKDPLDAFLDGLRRAKMELHPIGGVSVEFGDRIYPFEPIFYSYLKEQTRASFLDFDDMIYLAIRGLLEDRSLRHAYQSKFEFVLVDEFQDLNQAQLLLLQMVALPENNIFAVGDDDQMIYGFRGADVRHIVEFDKRFPILSNHVLNTNYRSSRMIVRHSGWLIKNNTDRIAKNIQPRPGAQLGKFEISGHATVFQQADYAAKWLMKHKQENNLNWKDYAILFRHNAYQFPLAVMLDTLQIPHSPVSGQHIFQSAVGRDIYAYLHIAFSPSECRLADFERILKRPNKYFTNQLISRVHNWATFLRLPDLEGLRDWEQEKLADFVKRMQSLSSYARTPGRTASDCIQTLKTEFSLVEFYNDQSRLSDDLDQASDTVYLDVISALAENFKTVAEFYQHICNSMDASDAGDSPETMKQQDLELKRNEVFLSTIHKSKGKEFQNVVYFNLSQMETGSKAEHLEEERRVAYVAATRPKDDLLVTFSSAKPSLFLKELSLNPKYKQFRSEELSNTHATLLRHLQKEKTVLRQIERIKQKTVANFDKLTRFNEKRYPQWLVPMIWSFHNRRMDQAQKAITKIELRFKKHTESVIEPLLSEIDEMNEEIQIRAKLGTD
jgi:DNA helicase-2/ATP-dependent DNA helicase PcrA